MVREGNLLDIAPRAIRGRLKAGATAAALVCLSGCAVINGQFRFPTPEEQSIEWPAAMMGGEGITSLSGEYLNVVDVVFRDLVLPVPFWASAQEKCLHSPKAWDFHVQKLSVVDHARYEKLGQEVYFILVGFNPAACGGQTIDLGPDYEYQVGQDGTILQRRTVG